MWKESQREWREFSGEFTARERWAEWVKSTRREEQEKRERERQEEERAKAQAYGPVEMQVKETYIDDYYKYNDDY
jgi:hypothetical protein